MPDPFKMDEEALPLEKHKTEVLLQPVVKCVKKVNLMNIFFSLRPHTPPLISLIYFLC